MFKLSCGKAVPHNFLQMKGKCLLYFYFYGTSPKYFDLGLFFLTLHHPNISVCHNCCVVVSAELLWRCTAHLKRGQN